MAKKKRSSNKPPRSRSVSMAKTRTRVVTRTKTVFRRAKGSIGKINLKKEATHAAIGIGLGLAVKYGGQFLAGNNAMAQEAVRRAANVVAAYGGKGTGELGYQIADAAINHFVIAPSGGLGMGGGPGEFA